MDKNTANEFRDFLESNFVWVNRDYSFYFIQTKMTNLKDLKLEDVIYQKAYSNIIIWSSMEKTFMINQLFLKWNDMEKWEINNRTRSRRYYWMFIRIWLYKNYYRLIAIDLSRKKKLNADPKATEQIEFVGQLKHEGSIDADGGESMFF